MKGNTPTFWKGWSWAWLGCVLVVFAAGVAVGRSQSPWTLPFVLTCLGALCFIAFFYWQSGLLLLIAWLVVEDLIRKYLGNNMLLYFSKDALFLSLLGGFLMTQGGEPRKTPFYPPFLFPLGLFLAMALLQTFNPESPSPLYGLLGFRMNFFYLPLLWVGFYWWQTPQDLGRFWTFCLGVGAIVAFLGTVQGIVGLHFLNPPTLAEEIRPLASLVREAPLSGYKVPRPCSVFVSDGRFAHFMLLCLILNLGLIFALWNHPEWNEWLNKLQKTVSLISLSLCTVGLMMIGSRGGFLTGLITLLLFLIFSPSIIQWERWARTIFALLGILTGVFCIVVLFAPEAIKARWAFYWETLSPSSPRSELFERVFRYHPQNFLAAFNSPYALFGQGFGTNSLGIQYLRKFVSVPLPAVMVESGLGNIVAEVGIVGLAFWLLWSFAVVKWAWDKAMRLREHPLFFPAFSLAWFVTLKIVVPLWGGMAGFQEFIGNAFLWLSLGLLGRMASLKEKSDVFSTLNYNFSKRGEEV
jgi:hypothetical protein